MLEEQQVVLVGTPEQRVLERVRVPVADAAEPPDPERPLRHNPYSSAFQSRVSITLATSRRNDETYAPSTARWSNASASRPTEWIAIDSEPSGEVTTTGLRLIPSVERIATWGWAMIGKVKVVPYPPGLVIVNVPPVMSSAESLRELERRGRQPIERCREATVRRRDG